MRTWITKAWIGLIVAVIMPVAFLPGVTKAGSGPSRIAGARQPVPAVSAQPQEPRGPVSRETTYSVHFINNGPAEITLDRVFDHCMYGAGPGSIYLNSYSSFNFTISDSNNWLGCAELPKAVAWKAYPTTDKGSTEPYDIVWIHWRTGAWFSIVGGPIGSSDGKGIMTSAYCDGAFCLDFPAAANFNNSLTIYFDGSYDGHPKPPVITWPANHTAIHPQAYVAISGTATPDTQVTVTAKDHTETPWADHNGNWKTNAVYYFDAGQVFAATATGVDGTYTSTFISVPPVTIDGPTSPVAWSDSIVVSGTAFPKATVSAFAGLPRSGAPNCSAPVADNGQWSCALTGLTPNTSYVIAATQNGDVSINLLFITEKWHWIDTLYAQRNLDVGAVGLTFTSPTNDGHIDGDSPAPVAVSGTGTPGGQITIGADYSTTKQPVYASINAQGTWQTEPVFRFPSASPSSRSYSVNVSQQANGKSAPGATLNFNSWPSLLFTYPKEGATLSSNQTSVAVTGTAVAGGTVFPSQPLMPDNGATVCGTQQVGSNGAWSCPLSNLRPASYTLNMKQSMSGQEDAWVPIHFSVARPVSVDVPNEGQTYPLQTTQLTFQGQGQPAASLRVSVPGASPCQDQVIDNSGHWSCLVSGLKPGTSYTATVTEGDSTALQGGGGWTDPPVTRHFSITGFDPLTVASPTENQVFASTVNGIFASGQAQLGAQLHIDVPGAQPCQDQWIGPVLTQWHCWVMGLQPGTSYVLTATQSVDQVSDVPKQVDFAIAKPLVVLLPMENQVLPMTDRVDISGTGQPNATVSITAGTAYPCTTTANDQGQWRCTVVGLSFGTYYTANVTQSGPGWQDPAVPRDFSVPQGDSIAIVTPRDKSVVSSNNPIDGMRVSGTGQSGATAHVSIDKTSAPPADIVNGTWTAAPISLSRYGEDGAQLNVLATEYVGTTPQRAAYARITVARAATILTPKNQTTVQSIGKVTVAGMGQHGAKITVNIVDGNGPTKGCETTVGAEPLAGPVWSCVLTGILPSSTYTLSVLQSGQAGEWADQPVGSIFHTRAPRPVVYGHPAPGDGLPANTPYDVTGTGEPDAQLSLKLMGVIDLGFTTVQGDGTWAFTNLLSSGPGCYSLTATQMLDGYPLDQGTTQYPVGGATCPGGSAFYITQPMPDQVLVGSSYIVQGYGTPGYTVTFPNGPSCQTLVQRDGTWTCGPYPITAAGTYNLLAQQTQNPNIVSGTGNDPTSTRRFSVLKPVAVSSPNNGATIYWPNNQAPPPFSVTGTATPGVLVEVSQTGGSGGTQYVTASSEGTWSSASVFQTAAPYPGGTCTLVGCVSVPLTISARQIYGGEIQDTASVTVQGQYFFGGGSAQRQGAQGQGSPRGPGSAR